MAGCKENQDTCMTSGFMKLCLHVITQFVFSLSCQVQRGLWLSARKPSERFCAWALRGQQRCYYNTDRLHRGSISSNILT